MVRSQAQRHRVTLVFLVCFCECATSTPHTETTDQSQERRDAQAAQLHKQLARCAQNPKRFCQACLNNKAVFGDETDREDFHRICRNYVATRRCAPGFDDPNLPVQTRRAMCQEATLGQVDDDANERAEADGVNYQETRDQQAPSAEEQERLKRELVDVVQSVDAEEAGKVRRRGTAIPPGCEILPDRIQASGENRLVPTKKGMNAAIPVRLEQWTARFLLIDLKAGTIAFDAEERSSSPRVESTTEVRASIRNCRKTTDPVADEPARWKGNAVAIDVASWRSRSMDRTPAMDGKTQVASARECTSKEAASDFLTVFSDAQGAPVAFELTAAQATGCSVFGTLALEPYTYGNGNGSVEVQKVRVAVSSKSPNPKESEGPTTKTGKVAFKEPIAPPLPWTAYGITITLREDPAHRSLTTFPDGAFSKCMTYVGVCSTTVEVCCMDVDGKGPLKAQCSQRAIEPVSPGHWHQWQASCYSEQGSGRPGGTSPSNVRRKTN